MLCEDKFSVTYQLDNSSDSQRFLINGKIARGGTPGVVLNASEGENHLKLRYMEYLEQEKTAIMSFVCS